MEYCETSLKERDQTMTRLHLSMTRHRISNARTFRNSVLHLHTRVHFHKVMLPILVNEELDSTSISVVGTLEQTHGIVENLLTNGSG